MKTLDYALVVKGGPLNGAMFYPAECKPGVVVNLNPRGKGFPGGEYRICDQMTFVYWKPTQKFQPGTR